MIIGNSFVKFGNNAQRNSSKISNTNITANTENSQREMELSSFNVGFLNNISFKSTYGALALQTDLNLVAHYVGQAKLHALDISPALKTAISAVETSLQEQFVLPGVKLLRVKTALQEAKAAASPSELGRIQEQLDSAINTIHTAKMNLNDWGVSENLAQQGVLPTA